MFEAANISQIGLKGLFGGGFENNNLRKFVTRKMLKRYIHLLLILCPIVSYGQFSANVKYLFGQSDKLDEYQISQDGIHASLEYGFRLKEKRLEFHPGLGYRFTFYNNKDGNQGEEYDQGNLSAIDFDFNTNIYPFDFGGDCNCPTFSKDGNVIKKGFFLVVAPGLAYQSFHFKEYPLEGWEGLIPYTESKLVWKASIGAGLDIGLSEQFTLTPQFSWTMISNTEWDIHDLLSDAILDDLSYLSTGLRLTYKPDPKRLRRN